MIRLRRYRAFLVFAVLSIIALYHFARVRDWQAASAIGAGSLKQLGIHVPTSTPSDPQQAAEETKPNAVNDLAALQAIKSLTPPPPVAPIRKPVQQLPPGPATLTSSIKAPLPTLKSNTGIGGTGKLAAAVPQSLEEILAEQEGEGEGRLEVEPLASTASAVHWTSQPEHFPVSSTIQLPRGSPKPIPRVQHAFGKESLGAKSDREQKLAAIAEAFEHSWKGYKKYAWMQDELSPVSAGNRNPFCGWAATLVDTLDTLWIMGLKEEFAEAAEAVRGIDFTTSARRDIPMFETTIRYLGGLVAAYDISDRKYGHLLDKAVQLAEIMIGAFDTPNRMPVTYYYWMPTFASQPHRATTRVVLAELGSLSLEFTRLAQLTGEPKYYDAIARITDALEEWQNSTSLPGMWPLYVDASGCEKADRPPTMTSHSLANGPQPPIGSELDNAQVGEPVQVDKLPPLLQAEQDTRVGKPYKSEDFQQPESQPVVLNEPGKTRVSHWGDPLDEAMPAARAGKGETYADLDQSQASAKQKRKLEAHDVLDDHVRDKAAGASPLKSTAVDGKSRATVQDTEVKSPKPSGDGCIPQGLTSPVKGASEQFTLGGRSDSVYEYLPKEFLLLGGVVDQYKTMYEYSMEAVIDKVLFRPMVPGERDILVPGRYASNAQGEDGQLTPESEHLACFAGGMFALGAKIFNRKGDLDIARRLTDGCVWAYESTTTGIMPELYQAVACESRYECSWNETKWWDVLDPYRAARTKALAPFPHLAPSTSIALVPTSAAVRAQPAALTSAAVHVDLEKRQFDEVPGAIAAKAFGTPVERPIVATGNILGGAPAVYTSPPPPLSHEEYVKAKISEERLPPGFKSIPDSKYILRPEAIESVFYMYRITGDDYWREKGWKMFMAIQKYTRVEYGYSAIDDVTKSAPELKDEMESFWLAETLKYFYLLFSDPELVSLDDWVLNTEAHPFRRPTKPQER